MYNRGIFQFDVVINIAAARKLWEANVNSPGSIPDYIINKIELIFGRQNLDFHPQRGDILESQNSIVMFDGFADSEDEGLGKGMKIFFKYDKKTGRMEKIKQSSLNGVTVMVGYAGDYIYATNENKKLFYENMSKL